jgi:hypothetical protein
MRPLILLLVLAASAAAEDFVRPWIVMRPPKVTVPTVASPTTPVARPTPHLLPAGFTVPLVLTPCTWFPGNPVFLIEGDKITMRKAPDR